jgi:hypothetical protein
LQISKLAAVAVERLLRYPGIEQLSGDLILGNHLSLTVK